jgi:SAM-dependent methyltransferase
LRCRHCFASQLTAVLDLGFAPPSNAYLNSEDLQRHEKHYPLRLSVCELCRLVQTEDFTNREELFTSEYAYFSSTSLGWLEHSARYVEAITRRLGLGRDSLAIEVACNDGYLLKNFVAAGIPCLGIEPTASTAAAAEKLGIPVRREFFGEQFAGTLATEGKRADLIIGNNVFAHVPDINDFTRGLKAALRPGGTITLEFPHLLRLIEHTQFDTVYHEHFSYLSLHTVSRVFAAAGLRVFDVEELPTHGGSLRVYGAHADDARATSPAMTAVLADEIRNGLESSEPYRALQGKSERIKDDLLAFLIDAKRAGKTVAAYGAAAKGNTLLNYAGVRPDLLSFVCDAAPAKQGKFLPGSHIPILVPQALRERRPDIILVLPWNIATEVVAQNSFARDWGARFFAAIPSMREFT